jgi:hypothetical protein
LSSYPLFDSCVSSLDKELPKLAVLPFIALFLGDDPKADPEFFVGVPKFDELPFCGFPLLEFSLTPGDPNGDPPAFVGLPKPEVSLFCVLPKEGLPLPGNPKLTLSHSLLLDYQSLEWDHLVHFQTEAIRWY